MKQQNKQKGFTLAELLIVVAIIGVLVAVSIPIFTDHLERSRQAVDLTTMRNAKAAAVIEYMITGVTGKYYYYTDGTVSTTTPPSTGYGKSHKDASEFAAFLNASGKPYDGSAKYVTVIIDSAKDVSIQWGTVYGAKWSAISGKVIDTSSGGNWYGTTTQDVANKNAALNIINGIDNDTRREADLDVLSSIATYLNNCSDDTLHNILGSQYKNIVDRTGGVLFTYQIDKAGSYSVRLNPDAATNNLEYLNILGYNPKVYNKTYGEGNQFSFTEHNYVDTYLFTSDTFTQKLAQTRQIWVDVTSTGTKIWIKDSDLSVEVNK